MTFDENPFRVLNVSIYDTQTTIVERADDLAFADPDREEFIERARDILLNPRKRIAAEVRWFVGCSREEEQHLVNCASVPEELFYCDELSFPLAEMNKCIYSLKNIDDTDDFTFISSIDELYSALNAEEIREQINAARAKSKFPAVQDTITIKDELKNLRDDIRREIQGVLKRTHSINLAQKIIYYQKTFGVIGEDFFDGYRLEMNPFLDQTREKILSLLPKIKIRADQKFITELKAAVESFAEAKGPLDKFSMALGTNDFADSEEIFYAVRETAIDLHNDKHLIEEPLRITRLLQARFSYLPHLAEVIGKDVKFLEEEAARRPTKSFLDAKAALDKIQEMMDQYLHCEKGFERINLDFYEKIFMKNCDVILTGLMLPNRFVRKPKEWIALNIKVAVIYLHMGTAMTWTRRADLALENFRKAVPYAEASGDAELIELARKRVNEFSTIAKRDSSGGCLTFVGEFFAMCLIVLILAWIWEWITR